MSSKTETATFANTNGKWECSECQQVVDANDDCQCSRKAGVR